MDEKWEVELYETGDGTCAIQVFLDNIKDKKLRAKVYRDIQLLSEYGNRLTEPYVKPIKNGIWELRTQQSNNISRILYFYFVGHKIVLTNGFIKKTQKTPEGEIEKAVKAKNDYEVRRRLL